MTDSDRLRASLPPPVRLVESGGLPHLDVATGAATARVFFHGAQLTGWQPTDAAAPVVWVSAHSHFRRDKAIRGGVPICFPWFGPHGADATAPAHGFVRLAEWTLTEATETADGAVALTFALETDARTSPLWPRRSHVACRMSIGATLDLALTVQNRDDVPFRFEEALHTYYAVSDIERVTVAGLEQTEYLDKVEGFARKRQAGPVHFTAETDRVFLDTTATCHVVDPGWSRTIVVSKAGSRSTVVWNPWQERARAFSDFGDDEWRRMVCVETANVRDAAVRLEPGESHTLQATVSIQRDRIR